MQKINRLLANNPRIINLLIPLLIIGLYLGLFLRPKLKQVSLLLPAVSRLQAKVRATEKDWANRNSFKQQISRLNEKIDYYEKKLPGEKEIPAILEYLSEAAKRLNVRLTEIKPIEQSENKHRGEIYYSVPILLKAECGYHQIGRFINELERADRFMKISDIKIEAGPTQGNTLSIELITVTYVMGQ